MGPAFKGEYAQGDIITVDLTLTRISCDMKFVIFKVIGYILILKIRKILAQQ